MTRASASCRVPKVDFQLSISNLSNLDNVWSDTYIVQNTPWQINIKKIVYNGDIVLSTYLYCVKEGLKKSKNWSTVAFATFKLLPFDESKPPFAFSCEPYIYREYGDGYGEIDFIKWDDLLDANNCYVKDDTINMHIEIEATDPNDMNKSALILKKSETCVINHDITITNIESLLAVEAPPIQIQKVNWNLTVYKNRMTSTLFVRIEHGSAVSCKMEVMIKLISSKGAALDFRKSQEQLFQEETGQGENLDILEVKLLPWDELLNPENGYVNNNTVTMEIEMRKSKLELPQVKFELLDDQDMQIAH